jgi:flagellar hook-length control protein FliK
MPRAIQQFLPPAPIKKATLLPPKPNQVAQRRERAEDFREALKTARKSNDATADPQPKPTKVEAKKAASKPESKTAAKTRRKSESKDSEQHDQVDETSQEQHHAATKITGQSETEAQETEEAPVPEDKSDSTHDAQAHSEHPEQDAVPTDAVAAQLIRPVDRAKDQGQPKREKDEKPEKASGVDASQHQDASPDAATATNSALPVQNTPSQPAIKRPRDGDGEMHPSSSATDISQNALAQQAAAAAQSSTGASAANPKPADPATLSSNQPSTQPRPVTPIVSALGAQPAPIQPPTAGATAADRATSPSNVDLPADPSTSAQDVSDLPEDVTADDAPAHKDTDPLDIDLDPTAQLATDALHHPGDTPAQAAKLPDAPPPPSPEVDFAQTNHDRIVTGVHSQLLPHGGTMEIRLDPPELGALKVMVEMRDGVMNATFQTSNEQATQLLSHSLNQLKHVLETQGVSVERIQVQQAPKSEQSPQGDHQQQQQQQQHNMSDDHAARQEQQRKEMMRRMWRRVSGAGDPIDYVA